MSKKTLRLAAAGLGASILLTACGSNTAAPGKESDPRERLSNAASNLADDRYATWDLSIQGAPEDVVAIGKGGSDFTTEDAQKLLGSSLTIKSDSGEKKDDPSDDLSGINLQFDGTDLGDLVTQGSTAYVKVNVDEVNTKYPEFKTQVDQINQAADQDPTLATFKPLFAGSWVKVNTGPGSPLGDYMAQMGGGTQTPDPAQAEALRGKMEQALRDVLTTSQVVQADDDDNHLVATVNGRDAYAKLRPVLLDATKATGGAGAQQLESQLPAAETVPDKPFKIDLWVEDDTFKRMELNLSQFKTTNAGRVALRVDMDDKADISVPKDATELNLQPLLERIQQQQSAALM